MSTPLCNSWAITGAVYGSANPMPSGIEADGLGSVGIVGEVVVDLRPDVLDPGVRLPEVHRAGVVGVGRDGGEHRDRSDAGEHADGHMALRLLQQPQRRHDQQVGGERTDHPQVANLVRGQPEDVDRA